MSQLNFRFRLKPLLQRKPVGRRKQTARVEIPPCAVARLAVPTASNADGEQRIGGFRLAIRTERGVRNPAACSSLNAVAHNSFAPGPGSLAHCRRSRLCLHFGRGLAGLACQARVPWQRLRIGRKLYEHGIPTAASVQVDVVSDRAGPGRQRITRAAVMRLHKLNGQALPYL